MKDNPGASPGSACVNNEACASGICRADGTCAALADGAVCAQDQDCQSGVCNNEICGTSNPSGPTGPTGPQGTTPCTSRDDCGSNEECQFPSGAGGDAEGVCAPPCNESTDAGCALGQDCHGGRCYSQNDCTSGSAADDCLPGEVCAQAGYCTYPPESCYFPEQCPAGWVCNAHECVDPTNVDLGDCTLAVDCNVISACVGGGCDCTDGDCVPRAGSCGASNPCPQGSYCASSTCQPATPCTEQGTCTPDGLVCTNGYCTNPAPCGPANTCPAGQTCATSGCVPNGAECTRDEQCPAGDYCNTFAGACVPGCRNNTECAGQCSGATPCNCDAQHQCSTGGGGSTGQSCDSTAEPSECGAGMVCIQDDPECLAFPPLMTCAESCHVACDLFTAMIDPTVCPDGTTCGGGAGSTSDPTFMLIQLLLSLLLGGDTANPGASACY